MVWQTVDGQLSEQWTARRTVDDFGGLPKTLSHDEANSERLRAVWGGVVYSFVSINCGYTGPPFVDKLTGIRWQPDQYYSTGVPGTAPPPKGKQWGPYDVDATMRVFTEYPVNCYNIPVAKPGRYLLRLVMYYGNYDKAKSPPAFNVSFGISFAATVVLALKERVVSEIIGQVDSTELE
ncbi:unnamed protein product, partial [Closterium sp. NIES-53]